MGLPAIYSGHPLSTSSRSTPFDGEKFNGFGHALLVNAENSRADAPTELEEHLRQAIDGADDRIVGGWMQVS